MEKAEDKNAVQIQSYISPCGELLLGSLGDSLCLCDWAAARHRETVDKRLKKLLRVRFEQRSSDVIEEAKRQLDAYFNGKRMAFDIPLLLLGTDFQRAVWNKLLEIPYGETISYGEQARRLGIPKAVRAVASANGANPVAVIVPCHRVLGGNGKLTGYAGGLEAKRFLVEMEKKEVAKGHLNGRE